ncbi:MAG: hypothetical protein ABJM29_07225 [Rhizobiaceae bacterium]
MYLVFLIFAAFVLMGAGSPPLDEKPWSFKQKPHPRKYQYSDQQREIWEQALMGGGRAADICEALLDAEYRVYKLHYPAFVDADLSYDPDWQQAWRRHLVSDNYHLPTQCIVHTAHNRIVELLNHVGAVRFRFCGNLGSKPQTFDEDHLAAGLDQMLVLAGQGVPEAIINALSYASHMPNFELNTDVEYFLRQSLRKTYRFEHHWGVNHLQTELAAPRRVFVEDAVERRDLEKVLQTTASCAP